MIKKMALERRNTDGLSPTSPRLLESPLDFIVEDHMHIRAMCTEMETALSLAEVKDQETLSFRHFLAHDLPLLLQDEDADLLPLLLKRADEDDDLPRLKSRLDKEHHELEQMLPDIVQVFSKPPAAWTDTDKTACHHFIGLLRRHLILENAIMLPLARLRLTQDDLEQLRKVMMSRRGLGTRTPGPDQKDPNNAG